ncbi:MAG: FtsX-like permease family protein [Clostridia bacterium]|nr:FtsX-like permease family protein [Clostridia bacterium]
MKNPLYKRLKREFVHDLPKYIVIFLFLVLPIALCAGYMIGNDSMIRTYNEAKEKYMLEDGHFQTMFSLSQEKIAEIERTESIKVYPLEYKEEQSDKKHTVRIYDLSDRTEVDTICVHKGALPKSASEIALDRLYCENNGISVGDKYKIKDKVYKISGFVSLFDYSCLFKRNTDTMFNAQTFTIAILTHEGFDALDEGNLVYNYAYRFFTRLDEKTAHTRNSDLRKSLYRYAAESGNMLTDYLAKEDNQAINFSITDIDGDLTMMLIFGILIVGGLAFVFALSIKSQIEGEMGSIGTLKAMGYKNGELLRHYLILPTSVTLLAGVVGNVLAYTALKDYLVRLYYHSYSLPTYTTYYNAKAFLFTTVIPIALVVCINVVILVRSLKVPALQFLRGTLSKKRAQKVLPLSKKLPFMTRFRARVIGQNVGTYVALFFGTLFACVILLFGLMMSPLLSHYKEVVIASQLAPYQTVLKSDVPVSDAEAEKLYFAQLTYGLDDVMIYGVEKTGAESKYLQKLSLTSGKVVVNNAMSEKYGLNKGSHFTMGQKFGDKKYDFSVSDVFANDGALVVFIPSEDFLATFLSEEYLISYLSKERLTVEDAMIYKTITIDDLTTTSDQLTSSMGDVFLLFTVFSVILFALLIYLLAKIVIEKNAKQISMMKILGYKTKEVSRAYNVPTGIVVMVSLAINTLLSVLLIKVLWNAIVPLRMRGWVGFYVAPYLYPVIMALGFVSYLAVYFIESLKISKISLSETLKGAI